MASESAPENVDQPSGKVRIQEWILSGRVGKSKVGVFVLFLALLPVLDFLALYQQAPAQFEGTATPFASASPLSWRWWFQPHEQNGALKPPLSENMLSSVVFATPQSGWVVGFGGTILHTEDGGKSWKPQSSNRNQKI